MDGMGEEWLTTNSIGWINEFRQKHLKVQKIGVSCLEIKQLAYKLFEKRGQKSVAERRHGFEGVMLDFGICVTNLPVAVHTMKTFTKPLCSKLLSVCSRRMSRTIVDRCPWNMFNLTNKCSDWILVHLQTPSQHVTTFLHLLDDCRYHGLQSFWQLGFLEFYMQSRTKHARYPASGQITTSDS